MSGGIRRRRPAGAEDGDGESSAQRALESLKRFDVYTKVHDDYVQKSQTGGIVTLITSCIIALLFWEELAEFCSVEVVHSISVDTRINMKLPISLNVTFPHLRCDEVSVDTVDSAGDNQVNVHGGLVKLPLDASGILALHADAPAATGACLSCLEAEDQNHRCCNTCQELKDAYREKEIPYFHVLDVAQQCKGSIGCEVSGTVVVNKVSGNVHVALGRSTIRDGKHVHEFNMQDVGDGFNTSHVINSITFGDRVPGVVSPLDRKMKIVRHGAYMFHYYIKLVPTVFVDRWGYETYTNQYAFTDSARNVKVRNGELSGLPGVFIVYDFSPFLMRKTEKTKPWSYIFTSICAITGGVFSIASLVEMVVNSLACRATGQKPG